MRDKPNGKQQKFFGKDEKTKEKIREYEKREPVHDDDYIAIKLQEELLKERENGGAPVIPPQNK